MSIQIALTAFFMSLPLFLVGLPFWVERSGKTFNDNVVTHLIIKRCCWILACWLMTVVSAVMLTMTVADGTFNVSGEISMYLSLFGWAGYLLMFWLIFTTIRDAVTLRNLEVKQKRYGP